jgi:hypothetical protein
MTTLVMAGTVYLVLASAAFAGQDPIATLPGSYTLEFENDYVKVVRVHYDAGAKLPDHTHPAGTTVYVYLNDSDGVVFRHSSGSGRAVTRPPVKAGAIRVSTGPEEHHAVENTSPVATDFLRIFLKTEDGGRTMRRIPPTEMEFSNKQLRITRVTLKSGEKLLTEANENPVLRIPVSPGMKEWKVLPSSGALWIEPGKSELYTTSGEPNLTTQIVRIEFLTKPK